MAKRRRKTTRRKKNRTLSSGGAVRRRRSSRRSRGLADMFNPTVLKNSVKTAGAGALGGIGAVITNKVIIPATAGKLPRVAAAIIVGALAANFGAPAAGAGYTGGLLALTFQNGLLADDADFAPGDSLSDKPIYLDSEGNPMVLEEGGNYRYLEEDEIDALAEAGAFDDHQLVD